MKKRGLVVCLIVIGGLIGYFIYLWQGETPTPKGAFETEAGELCAPMQTVDFEDGTTLIVYGCKSLHNINEGLLLGFLFFIAMSASFILGTLTVKRQEVKE